MNKKIISCSLLAVILFCGCKKKVSDDDTDVATVTESDVLNDFAHVLANPNYLDIQSKANTLYSAVQTLNTSTTDINLAAAQTAWRETRHSWERAEGFLFGPVEDFNYDPQMDDWPLNRVDMDSLLASNNALALSDIEALPTSLKGFHSIEYMLFGTGGQKTAAEFTAREKLYMISLTQSLYNTTTDLRNSWDPGVTGNFTLEFVNAGNGSTRFATRKEAFMAIVTAMAAICDEVANGKMEEPLAAQDSSLEESQFAHSSTSDFQNNMTGLQNAYTGNYSQDGRGLDDLVASKNLSLNNTIKAQITTAINAFNSINSNYGAAIYSQQQQIHDAQDAINTLKSTIENDLTVFVNTYITD